MLQYSFEHGWGITLVIVNNLYFNLFVWKLSTYSSPATRFILIDLTPLAAWNLQYIRKAAISHTRILSGLKTTQSINRLRICCKTIALTRTRSYSRHCCIHRRLLPPVVSSKYKYCWLRQTPTTIFHGPSTSTSTPITHHTSHTLMTFPIQSLYSQPSSLSRRRRPVVLVLWESTMPCRSLAVLALPAFVCAPWEMVHLTPNYNHTQK